MSSDKVCITKIALTVLFISGSSVLASKSWQQWENLRWSGLQQFSKGNIEAAQKWFEQALAEAVSVQPGSENEVTSTHDLALIYEAEGKSKKAEEYCNRALELGKRVCSPSHKAMITLILDSLADIKSNEGKHDEVANLQAEMDKLVDSSPDAQTIGVAEMKQDGTIKLDLAGEAHGMAFYKVADPNYRGTLMHIGPLKPGGHKMIAPWK